MSSYFYDSWLAKKNPLDYVKDKRVSSKAYINYMMIRIQQMFKYENLPETIPQHMLEYYLINNGTCFVTEVNGELYAFTGSFGGEPDPYYRPTRYIIANPALKLSKDYDIQKDGVLVRNDSMWMGLYPLMARYASLMAENLLTIRSADVMLRVVALLTAPDDRTKIAAETYLKKLENGEFGVIGEKRFIDEGLRMQSPPSNNGSYLTQFIELHQYLKGSFYNEIGLNANFNMKREAIGEGESSLNEDSLLPLCDEMLRCRQQDVEKINKMFGTNISVEFDSAWAQNVRELELQLAQLEKDASQLASKEGDEDESRIELPENGVISSTTSENVLGNECNSEGDDNVSNDVLSEGRRVEDSKTEECPTEDAGADDGHDGGLEVHVEVSINSPEQYSEKEGVEEDDESSES